MIEAAVGVIIIVAAFGSIIYLMHDVFKPEEKVKSVYHLPDYIDRATQTGDFGWALSVMKSGSNVYRKKWRKYPSTSDVYLFIHKGKIYSKKEDSCQESVSLYSIDTEDILAEDWRVHLILGSRSYNPFW